MKFPSIKDVAKALTARKSEVGPSPQDSVAVRLQVLADGQWRIHSGIDRSGTEHLGFWGAGTLTRSSECRNLARELLRQAHATYAATIFDKAADALIPVDPCTPPQTGPTPVDPCTPTPTGPTESPAPALVMPSAQRRTTAAHIAAELAPLHWPESAAAVLAPLARGLRRAVRKALYRMGRRDLAAAGVA